MCLRQMRKVFRGRIPWIRCMERDYPKYKAVLLRMIDRMIKDGCFEKVPEATPELIWEWWISKENIRDFLMKRNQKELF